MAELTPQNFPQSTLASGISAGATSLTVATGEGTGKGFSDPAGTNVGRLVIKRASDGKLEIVTFTDRAGDVFTLGTRAAEPAQGDQTAYAFVTGDQVSEVATNAGLDAILAREFATHTAAADPHTGYVLESLLDAKGDLYAASADNTPGRLAVGSNAQVLTADSTQTLGVRWGTPPAGSGVRAYHSADQNVADVTETALALNSERHDDAAEHDTATNTSRLTAVASGMRTIVGSATFDTPVLAGTVRRLSIRLNGTTVIQRQEDTSPLASAPTTVNVSAAYYLSAGDYVELMAYQDSGATLAIKSNGNYSPEFGMILGGTGAAGSGTLDVEEVDGTPNVSGVVTIKVPNGTLTDLGGGAVQLSPAALAALTLSASRMAI